MDALSADVVVVGSGIGGATTPLALSREDADVLVIERGERVPREDRDWDTPAVFMDGGFFPSSAAMNPALTIASQALRVVAESDLRT